MYDPYYKRRCAARLKRERLLMRRANYDLPIDGDNSETRKPLVQAGSLFDAVIDSLTAQMHREEAKFFETLCEAWPRLFPTLPMIPGRWQQNRIILYVANAGQSFAMRAKLPAVKKKLKTLPGAPRTFSLIVEIHDLKKHSTGAFR